MVKLTFNETTYEFKELNRKNKTYFNGMSLVETNGVLLKNGKDALPFESHWEDGSDTAHYHFECGDNTFGMSGKKGFPLEISLQIILKYLEISK